MGLNLPAAVELDCRGLNGEEAEQGPEGLSSGGEGVPESGVAQPGGGVPGRSC